MKTVLIIVIVFVATLPCRVAFAATTNDPAVELQALVEKVSSDIASGKTTEDALSNDIKQYDVLLAEHKGEKTDDVAKILLAKEVLYAEVFQESDKADALFKQLTNDFSGTELVAMLQKQQEQEAAVEKIQADLVVGKPFPDFNEKDVMGKPLSVANYKGKVVLIDFWATWCVPCMIEMPNVIATYQKYHDKGFEIIGVSLDQDQQKLQTFIKENNVPWQQYFDGQGWGNNLASKYGIQVIPSNFLLDTNGIIIGKDLKGDDLTNAVANAVNK